MHQDVIASTGLAFLIIGLAVLTARKTKFSPIPILIIFGMLAGPEGPWKLLSSTPVLEFLSRVGVLLLLLYMGLEFSMSALVSSGKSILTGGTIYVGLNLVRGALLGLVFFGPSLEALVAAGITTVSSSAIVTKIIMDLKRTANRETEMIMGLIMYEDIFVAVFLAVISSLALTGTADLTSYFSRQSPAFYVSFYTAGQKSTTKRATNYSGKQSMNIGTGIIARGEFAVITATLAEAAALSPVLQPFTALYVLILAFAAPWLAKNSQKIFGLVSKAKLSSVRS